MRRSGRDAKQVQHFKFSDENRGRHTEETDEEDLMDTQSADGSPIQHNRDRAVGKVSSVVSTGSGQLYDAVNKRQIVSAVEKWIADYKKDKVSAMVDLVNFILQAAGAQRAWVARDVDLEALGPSEIDDLLADMLKAMAESGCGYPLADKGKGVSFRDRYQQFFTSLVEKLRALPAESAQRKSLHGAEILQTVADQLVTLSSMHLVNVRDAVTEAALCLGSGVVAGCLDLKGQLAVAQRQMGAEETQRGAVKSNPKYLAFVKQSEAAAKELDALSGLATTLFNSVLVHRLRDFHESVRLVAVRHLRSFLEFDAKRAVRVEYLKYVGFACSDYSAAVRLEAVELVTHLLEDEHAVGLLPQFTEHFMERFVAIAKADADQAISLRMLQALRTMQQHGLLDALPEEQLDRVDELVFDAAATAAVRSEALRFFMDHTEGFEATEEEENGEALLAAADKGRGKGKSKSAANDDEAGGAEKALARRQRNAQQLETLTEFAELHVDEHFAEARLLAEACMQLDGHRVLFDWSTIIALLLRESNEVISLALRASQTAILLRMFTTSALLVNRRRAQCQTQVVLSSEDRAAVSDWEALNAALQRSLPALILRFKDDDNNLELLVALFDCCDFASGGAGGSAAAQKCLKTLLHEVGDLLCTVSEDAVVAKLLDSLRKWRALSGGMGAVADKAAAAVFTAQWSAAQGAIDTLLRATSGRTTSSAAKFKSKARQSGATVDEHMGVLRGLAGTLSKCARFWASMDCRPFLPTDDGDDAAERLTSACTLCTELCGQNGLFEGADAAEVVHLVALCGESASNCLRNIVLWHYMDTVQIGRSETPGKRKKSAAVSSRASKKTRRGSKQQRDVSENEEEDGDESAAAAVSLDASQEEPVSDELSAAATQVAHVRGMLVDVFERWMAQMCSESAADRSPMEQLANRRLAVLAFAGVAELRNYFPAMTAQRYVLGDALVFSPSQTVLGLLRSVFEAEGAARQAEAAEVAGENPAKFELRTKLLVQRTLFPLSRSLLVDTDNLNRNQAAAVLVYLTDPSEQVQEAVKAVARRLKDSDAVKFFETQFIALKTLFAELVEAPIQARLRADAAEEEDSGFDLLQHAQLEESGYGRCEALARKLAQSLGVGKLKDRMLDGLCSLLRAGINFAVTASTRVGFAGLLVGYVRFLPPASLKTVAQYATDRLGQHPDLEQQLESAEAVEDEFVARDLAKLGDLLALLRGGSKPRMVVSKRRTAQSPALSSRNASPAQPMYGGRRPFSPSPRAPLVAVAKQQNAAKRGTPTGRQSAQQPPQRNGRAQQPVFSYAEEKEEEEVEEDSSESMEMEMTAPPARKSQQPRKPAMLQSSQQNNRFSTQSQQAQFAFGLDIEDADEEDDEQIEEEEEDFLAAAAAARNNKRAGVHGKRGTVRSNASTQQRGKAMAKAAAAVVEEEECDEEENDEEQEGQESDLELDSLPSARRFR